MLALYRLRPARRRRRALSRGGDTLRWRTRSHVKVHGDDARPVDVDLDATRWLASASSARTRARRVAR
jgi:hypothetical protein